jgi:hypothetical protein
VQLIDRNAVKQRIDYLKNQPLYIHLEMTMGAYTAHKDSSVHPASNFIKNAVIEYSHGEISDSRPYRVGLKLNGGWVYTEGLTHWDPNETERLILSGNDKEGKLIVALQLSKAPF